MELETIESLYKRKKKMKGNRYKMRKCFSSKHILFLMEVAVIMSLEQNANSNNREKIHNADTLYLSLSQCFK